MLLQVLGDHVRIAAGRASALDAPGFEKHYQFQAVLICLCHPTSHRDLDAVIDDGARSVEEIGERCGAGTGCGACVDELRDRLAAKGANGCARDCAHDLVSLRSGR
jgi:bacterioferritin-associated ferredoxin